MDTVPEKGDGVDGTKGRSSRLRSVTMRCRIVVGGLPPSHSPVRQDKKFSTFTDHHQSLDSQQQQQQQQTSITMRTPWSVLIDSGWNCTPSTV
jgi:hypothetical protein